MHTSVFLKRVLIVGGAVLVLGGAAVGVVAAAALPIAAQNQPQATNQRQQFETALANRLHISVDQLHQAVQGARQDVGLPPRGPGWPSGVGPRRESAFGAFTGKEVSAVATLFKETPEALRQEVSGKTLAEIATAHGVSVQDLVNMVVQTADQQLDQVAQTRNLPADRVSQFEQQISERAQQFVTTHRFPARGSGTRS